jgi:hypothetical protein
MIQYLHLWPPTAAYVPKKQGDHNYPPEFGPPRQVGPHFSILKSVCKLDLLAIQFKLTTTKVCPRACTGQVDRGQLHGGYVGIFSWHFRNICICLFFAQQNFWLRIEPFENQVI